MRPPSRLSVHDCTECEAPAALGPGAEQTAGALSPDRGLASGTEFLRNDARWPAHSVFPFSQVCTAGLSQMMQRMRFIQAPAPTLVDSNVPCDSRNRGLRFMRWLASVTALTCGCTARRGAPWFSRCSPTFSVCPFITWTPRFRNRLAMAFQESAAVPFSIRDSVANEVPHFSAN
jgi:hypothetical protein